MTNITNNEIVTSFTGLQSIYIYTQIQPPPTTSQCSGPAQPASQAHEWRSEPPTALTQGRTGGCGTGGTQVVGVFFGGCSVMNVCPTEGKTIGLIWSTHGVCLSAASLTTGPCGREWQCLTSRGGCVTVGVTQAQKQEPFYTGTRLWPLTEARFDQLSNQTLAHFHVTVTLNFLDELRCIGTEFCLQWEVGKSLCLSFLKLKLFKAFVQ